MSQGIEIRARPLEVRTGIRAGVRGGGWDCNHVKVRTGVRSGGSGGGGGWDYNHVKTRPRS